MRKLVAGLGLEPKLSGYEPNVLTFTLTRVTDPRFPWYKEDQLGCTQPLYLVHWARFELATRPGSGILALPIELPVYNFQDCLTGSQQSQSWRSRLENNRSRTSLKI